jgi:uncharacterized protein (TIGR02001 family)
LINARAGTPRLNILDRAYQAVMALLSLKTRRSSYLLGHRERDTMKYAFFASAIGIATAAGVAGSLAHAEDKKPEHEVTYNVSVVSDYRFRGISQTRLRPALQGGADYTHNPTGYYAGTWLSTIRWIKDTPRAGSTPFEWDIYGGKKGEITKDVTYDVGLLGYVYIDNKLGDAGLKDANTLELYGKLGYGPAYIKYSHALTNLFGNIDSKNSGYFDIGADIDLANDYKLNLHAGHQKVRGPAPASYTDYKIGASKTFSQLYGVTLALAAVGTNADERFYASPANGKFLGRKALVLSATKNF